MWVKICGTTNLEDALASVEAGADALGFIFASSPRRITPPEARVIVRHLPDRVEKVGVFVNESAARIHEVVEQVGLTAVQLHGDESLEFAAQLFPAKQKRAAVRVYPALSMKSLFSSGRQLIMDELTKSAIQGLLVDAGSPTRRGGTGLTFDWTRAQPIIDGLKRLHRIIVAGGLNPENVTRAIVLFRPWGVDVASGVEREPGKKDLDKVRAFVKAARAALKKESA